MAQTFDPNHMVVSRSRVFNKTTGRFLGPVGDFDMEAAPAAATASGEKPFVEDMSKDDMVEVAKEVSLPGYSSLNKDELGAALLEIGAVNPGSGEPEEPEEEPETEE